MKTVSNIRRTGLTLVELLVVIAIMGLLTALMVPQVRLINKDRNIREAARVVGTALAQARDRAVATGAAGLMIQRNTNLQDGNNSYYGGTRLYLMRKVPNYQGEDAYVTVIDLPDDPNDPTIDLVDITVSIPKPYQWDDPAKEKVIQLGDRIRLNHGSIRYPIIGLPLSGGGPNIPGRINLRIGLPGDPADPATTAGELVLPKPVANTNTPFPFVIERLPRKIESSRVDLPDGYIIDLRYSGYWNGTNGTTTEFAVLDDDQPIELIFNQDGSLDRLRVQGAVSAADAPGAPYNARGAIDLLVTEYRPEDALLVPGRDLNLNIDLTLRETVARAVLANSASLWVTLSHQTGGVNVGYNEPPTAADRAENWDPNTNDWIYDPVLWEVYQARGMSRDRTSANQ